MLWPVTWPAVGKGIWSQAAWRLMCDFGVKGFLRKFKNTFEKTSKKMIIVYFERSLVYCGRRWWGAEMSKAVMQPSGCSYSVRERSYKVINSLYTSVTRLFSTKNFMANTVTDGCDTFQRNVDDLALSYLLKNIFFFGWKKLIFTFFFPPKSSIFHLIGVYIL